MSNVRVEPLQNGRPVAETRHHDRNVALGGLSIAFGAVGWLLGSHYSIDGWVIGVNVVAAAIRIPLQVPAPEGWLRLLLILALGLAYSWAEVAGRPVRGWGIGALLASLVGLLLVHVTDAGTTFLAVMNPQPGAWPIALWLASQPVVAAVWSMLLTYVPEGLIIIGINLIVGIPKRGR